MVWGGCHTRPEGDYIIYKLQLTLWRFNYKIHLGCFNYKLLLIPFYSVPRQIFHALCQTGTRHPVWMRCPGIGHATSMQDFRGFKSIVYQYVSRMCAVLVEEWVFLKVVFHDGELYSSPLTSTSAILYSINILSCQSSHTWKKKCHHCPILVL